MKITLPEIRHNQEGFQEMCCLQAKIKGCLFDDIDIDMQNTTWFDADMCALFGAILYQLGKNMNTVRLINITPSVEKILSKNGFLSYYGRTKTPDEWGTTIHYRHFDVKDDRYFAGYVESELMHRPEMPTMSQGLLKKFRESVYEIFSNSVLHSRTELGIFSCGQFFPRRNQLNFSVVDLGIGIRQNIKENTGIDFAPEQAIQWATEGRNTTKSGQIPGGLGLKLLGEFIDLNGGRIQITSDAGYWRREKGKTVAARLSQAFSGTVVSLQINTADAHSYALASELSADDIF